MKLLAFALFAILLGAWFIKSLLDRAIELREGRQAYEDFDLRR